MLHMNFLELQRNYIKLREKELNGIQRREIQEVLRKREAFFYKICKLRQSRTSQNENKHPGHGRPRTIEDLDRIWRHIEKQIPFPDEYKLTEVLNKEFNKEMVNYATG